MKSPHKINAEVSAKDSRVLMIQVGGRSEALIPFSTSEIAMRIATAINGMPQVLRQLQETTNQLDLYTGPTDKGSLTVVNEARTVLDNFRPIFPYVL